MTSLLKIIRQIDIYTLRCCSMHVRTDGVNGRANCLLRGEADVFDCVISFLFLVCLNTTCSSSDPLKEDNVEPEDIQR